MRKNFVIKSFITVVIVIIVIIAFFFNILSMTTYNRFIERRNEVYEQQAQIENVLQARQEKIPDLVKVVKNYDLHEEKILIEVTEARSGLEKALQSGDMSAISQADNRVDTALYNLQAVVENYPELKSSENYTKLIDEISGSVNRIAQERREYNKRVMEYNTLVEKIPTNFIALIYGFKTMPYYTASDEAHRTNVVDFEDN
ncbi:MAG: LemA family protein [Clostridia bacterium]|nr:LemA family protein [Clostridia bacterium]